MTDINITLCRELLKQIKPLLKKAGVKTFSDGWVWKVGHDHWEFHTYPPDKYYWHGSASNAYEARFKGWSAWLEAKGFMEET